MMMTPAGGKRALKSPGTSSVSTVTPDPKRHMGMSNGSSEDGKVEQKQPAECGQPVIPTKLFGGDADANAAKVDDAAMGPGGGCCVVFHGAMPRCNLKLILYCNIMGLEMLW